LLAYTIGCTLLVSATIAIVLAVLRSRKPPKRLAHETPPVHPANQTLQPYSPQGITKSSTILKISTPLDDTSGEIETEPPTFTRSIESPKEQQYRVNPSLEESPPIPAVPGQVLESDHTRREESVASPRREIKSPLTLEEFKRFDGTEDGEARQASSGLEAGVEPVQVPSSFALTSNLDPTTATEIGPGLSESRNSGMKQSQGIDDQIHEDGGAANRTAPAVVAATSRPESFAANMEASGDLSGEPATAEEEAEFSTEIYYAEPVFTSPINGPAVEENTPAERKPRKYHGIARSAPDPQNKSREAESTESGQTNARDRSLPLAVRLRFDHDGFCNISLIAKRSKGLPEELSVTARSGQMQLRAMQDEWYQDIIPDDISQVLKDGTVWKQDGADGQFIWTLSGRDLFVLAARTDISGYISQSCLDLGRNHVVLCAIQIKSEVEDAIQQTGAKATDIVDESMGAPAGWVVLRGIVPTAPVPLLADLDVFNALRPVPHIEISLEEGIRIQHANWLEGHPPVIRVYGEPQHTADVRIDGHPASLGAGGDYRMPGWDSVGTHSVWCAGSIKSYSIVPFAASWERWDAYTFPAFRGSAERTSICGPLVRASFANGRSLGPSLVVPETNPILIGALPGDYAHAYRVSDVRAASFIASPTFRPVWALPRDPLHCDKRALSILLLYAEEPDVGRRGSTQVTNSGDERMIDAWISSILDTGRKGLRAKPETDEVWSLWLSYKRAAHDIWRVRR
jgi:hypothetical protein